MKTQQITLKEKVENAKIWIDSLAKTKVKQGVGILGNSVTGYCCLGWACKKLKLDYEYYGNFDDRLVDLMGLKSRKGTFKDSSGYIVSIKLGNCNYTNLAKINDTGLHPFREISTIIKDNLELLFEPKVAVKLVEHYKR